MKRRIVKPMPLVRRIVLLGERGVGKTALANRLYCRRFVQTYDPTVEDSYRTEITVDDQSHILEVLDVAGTTDSEDFGKLQNGWVQKSDGIVLVYDITSRSSFDRIEHLFQQVVKEKCWNTPCLPIIIVGNKSDKEINRSITPQEGCALARKLNCMFMHVSAKDDEYVQDPFIELVKILAESKVHGGCCILM